MPRYHTSAPDVLLIAINAASSFLANTPLQYVGARRIVRLAPSPSEEGWGEGQQARRPGRRQPPKRCPGTAATRPSASGGVSTGCGRSGVRERPTDVGDRERGFLDARVNRQRVRVLRLAGGCGRCPNSLRSTDWWAILVASNRHTWAGNGTPDTCRRLRSTQGQFEHFLVLTEVRRAAWFRGRGSVRGFGVRLDRADPGTAISSD